MVIYSAHSSFSKKQMRRIILTTMSGYSKVAPLLFFDKVKGGKDYCHQIIYILDARVGFLETFLFFLPSFETKCMNEMSGDKPAKDDVSYEFQ